MQSITDQMEIRRNQFSCLWAVVVFVSILSNSWWASSSEGPWYDSTAYTECKKYPEEPLYAGGILKDINSDVDYRSASARMESPTLVLQNLTQDIKYTFSCWVSIRGVNSSLIMAKLMSDDSTKCVGTVVARSGCWSFLKGGFVLESSYSLAVICFQSATVAPVKFLVRSASLQPFSDHDWRMHQDAAIRAKRKRRVTLHVSNANGDPLPGALVALEQIYKDFPLGSAIANTILGNLGYQKWFTERFNVAVFENELKWYVTEHHFGQLNYSLADDMLRFVRTNKIIPRGHNIFWEDPMYTPSWVRNLGRDELQTVVKSRIQSLMSRYSGEFIHWDVSNEMLHFDFYEKRLGPNATLQFFQTVQEADPYATLFMNDYNVIETCEDVNSTVDSYISRLLELKAGGARLEGIGLEGHFGVPNLPLMRAILDKLAILDLPVWLTEVDISNKIDQQMQAVYLEEVLREGFSHPSVNGIVLWTALHSSGCYQMCLTDNNLTNLPTGNVVDMLLQEWETREVKGKTDAHGTYSFDGFLGEYNLTIEYENRKENCILALPLGDETRHFYIKI